MQFYQHLERYATAVALLDERGTVWTYSRLCDEADRFAAELGPPRLVFLEARNRFDAIAAYLGCLRGGHTVYLFGPQDGAALDALVETYDPAVVAYCREDRIEIVRRDAAPLALAPGLRLLLSTSGSTGSAKFVKLSGVNLDANARAIAQYLALDGQSRAITTLKPNYSYGLSIIHSHLAVGGSLALTELSVTDPGFWPAFAATGADSLAGVPYTYEMLDRQGIQLSAIAGLRYATQAGGKLAPHLVRKFAQDALAAGRRFYVMYGQTEAAPRIAYLPPEMAVEFPDCIGVPVPGGSIAIVDDDGTPIAQPEVAGQLVYSGPNVMMGYATGRDDLGRDDTPAHLATGDIAVRTAEGLFRIVGRSARFVKPFGIRVNLDEVEQWVAAEHGPDACVGDDETIVVLLPTEGQADEREERTLAARVARAFKLPPGTVACHSVDAIPKLANGKTDYRALRASHLPSQPEREVPDTLLGLVFSRAFLDRSVAEALNILGLRQKAWTSVAAIFRSLLGAETVSPDDCFSDLAGDSLTYVQVALALEEYLGFLPEGWEHMSASDLENADAIASL